MFVVNHRVAANPANTRKIEISSGKPANFFRRLCSINGKIAIFKCVVYLHTFFLKKYIFFTREDIYLKITFFSHEDTFFKKITFFFTREATFGESAMICPEASRS